MPSPEPVWDDVRFNVHSGTIGVTHAELAAEADKAMQALAGGAEYRFAMEIRGIEQLAHAVPNMWFGEVSGQIRRT